MTSPYIVDSLLPMLRLLPLMPSVQALFTDSDLVNIMNFEMDSKIMPMMDNQAEEYGVYLFDIPYSNSITQYDMPIRAMGGKLRSVSFVDPNGNEVRIPRLRVEDIMSNVNATGLAINPALWGFYLQNNKVVTYLSTVNGGSSAFPTLRLRYLRQPNTLVLSSACGQITAIAGNVVTVNAVPSTFTTSVTYDLISNVPQMFVSYGDDLTITSIVGLNITFSATVSSKLQIGDFVCLAGQSPIPQIPWNPGFQLLLQLSAAKCLEIHGDTQGFNVAMSQATDMKNYFLSLLTPRVDGNVIRLTTPNALYGWD
jgi:hypothetical protein